MLGGARSGKSSYAQELAGKIGGKVAFIATCRAEDPEMKKRVTAHKDTRPRRWKTFEEPHDPARLLETINQGYGVVIIDCLTLLVSNLMAKRHKPEAIRSRILKLFKALKKIEAQSIIVSNEVGLGIVPANRLARNFRDVAGRVNQIAARESQRVFFLVSGLPWRIK